MNKCIKFQINQCLTKIYEQGIITYYLIKFECFSLMEAICMSAYIVKLPPDTLPQLRQFGWRQCDLRPCRTLTLFREITIYRTLTLYMSLTHVTCH